MGLQASEADDEPAPGSAGLEALLRVARALRRVCIRHPKRERSGLRQLPKAVEFLELTVVFALTADSRTMLVLK